MSWRQRPRRFSRWMLRLALALVLLSGLWWLVGADWAVAGLRVLANATLPDWVFGQLHEIVPAQGGWKLRTWLEVLGQSSLAVVLMEDAALRYTLRGLPLVFALVLATSGFKPAKLVWAFVLFALAALLACAGQIWGTLAVLINHEHSIIDSALPLPPFQVRATPLSYGAFYAANLADYLGRLIIPVVSAVVIWLALCHQDVRRLLMVMRHRRSA